MATLSERQTVKPFWPFWKGVYYKSKEFAPRRSKFFPFIVDPSSKVDCCAGKQTGSHKSYLPYKMAESLLGVFGSLDNGYFAIYGWTEKVLIRLRRWIRRSGSMLLAYGIGPFYYIVWRTCILCRRKLQIEELNRDGLLKLRSFAIVLRKEHTWNNFCGCGYKLLWTVKKVLERNY